MVIVGPSIIELPDSPAGVPCSTSSAAVTIYKHSTQESHTSETTGAVVPQGQTLFAIVCHVAKITKVGGLFIK